MTTRGRTDVTQGAAFTHLNKLGLLARQHANELPRKDGEPSLTIPLEIAH